MQENLITKQDYETWAKNVVQSMNTIPHYLEHKTINSIKDEIYLSLESEQIPEIDFFLEKLKDYRYVSEVCELFRGRHVRWIRLFEKGRAVAVTDYKLTNGGIVTDIKFLDNGIHIQCKNARNQFIQLKYDDCLFFQKLTAEECLFLMMQSKLHG